MFNCLHIGRPRVSNDPSDHHLSIASGDEQMTLTCNAFGDDIGVYWERVNDGPLPTENNMSSLMEINNLVISLHLIITRARPIHSGKYRCIVYSEWGIDQSNDVTVTIKSKRSEEILFFNC